MTKPKASVSKVSKKDTGVKVPRTLDAAERKEERKKLTASSTNIPDGESSDNEGEDIVFPFLAEEKPNAEDRL